MKATPFATNAELCKVLILSLRSSNINNKANLTLDFKNMCMLIHSHELIVHFLKLDECTVRLAMSVSCFLS